MQCSEDLRVGNIEARCADSQNILYFLPSERCQPQALAKVADEQCPKAKRPVSPAAEPFAFVPLQLLLVWGMKCWSGSKFSSLV